MNLEQTWRWYGPEDPVSLSDIKQAGATGVVTALHHIPNGELWPIQEIKKRKAIIESNGLTWSVVESVPVHEDIKTQSGEFQKYLKNYKQTLLNLSSCGVHTVCYNFMPVLDWTRTHLHWQLEDGSTALRFDKVDMAVFECFIMERDGAKKDYAKEILETAELRFSNMDQRDKLQLEENILKGLPGTIDDLTMPAFKQMIGKYKTIDHTKLKSNLSNFLNEVIPVAEKHNIKMAIHPDDPPFDILGLPRIVKSEKDLDDIMHFIDSPSNGITFCTGSLGANPENYLPEMIHKFGNRIHFLHLRNVKREKDGSFYEDNHLEGSSNMFEIVKAVLEIQKKKGVRLPMRPDHGHQMLDDLKTNDTYPGYTAIGRLRGLAELRGLEYGISKSLT